MSAAHVTAPRVECSTCGRWLTATTPAPYMTRADGVAQQYWYVKQHDRPEGEPCKGRTSKSIPVIGGPLESEDDPEPIGFGEEE